MSELGEVLELLYSARERYTSFQATIRTQSDVRRLEAAIERWAAQRPAGSVAFHTWGRRGAPEPEAIERAETLWFEKPSRWRHERELRGGEGTLTQIIDGDLWWTHHPQNGWQTNQGVSEPERNQSSLDVSLTQMFDPVGIIPALSLEPLEHVVHRGRDAIRLRGVPRERGEGHFFPSFTWVGADEHELIVDAERGVLLRTAAFLEGAEFSSTDIVSIAFDEPLPSSVFTPPPGVKLRVVKPPPDGPPSFIYMVLSGVISRLARRWRR